MEWIEEIRTSLRISQHAYLFVKLARFASSSLESLADAISTPNSCVNSNEQVRAYL